MLDGFGGSRRWPLAQSGMSDDAIAVSVVERKSVFFWGGVKKWVDL